ncbi:MULTISPECIES: Dps family protein [Heyndrickxia]|uniref:Non-specific DNA-binding protein Dps n=1 Tax=Heyndrickxia sporothermodurans TaxID=46224 RepID=A0A150KJM1_9BACI|nr:Dps family protein [Heyndrickxia sporothermodurans]KYC84865.1 Non-specific DNA-binding protein Dps [Heyndrickxia sporothermodurans]PTY80045.1 DNA starvation/stationary phase protection protein [Heyndrickxia sporothermodurans]
MEKQLQEVQEVLNKQVANWTVLYTKLHHFHWYVKGHHFFSLHEKLEELYNKADSVIDEFAERLLAINGKPVSTLKGSLELSSIKEAETIPAADEMVKEVVNDFTILIGELKEGIALANDAKDEVTGDMFISLQGELEKHVWMLKAYLG